MYTFRCFLDWQIIERGSGQCYFASVWADVCCSPGWACISYFVDLAKRRFINFFCFRTWSSENASGQVGFSYSFSSDWLRDWCELSDWLRDWCELSDWLRDWCELSDWLRDWCELSDWLRDWCELSWPERSKASPEQAWITFDILLKIFLNLLQYACSPYGSLYIS